MCNHNGGCCVSFARVMLIIFNTLFTLCGLLLIAVGVWLLVDPNVLNIVTPINSIDWQKSSLLRDSAILLLSTGCAVFLMSLLGFLGAVMRWRIALGIYIGLLVIVFCCEVAGAVLAIAFKDWLMDNMENIMLDSITDNNPTYYINSNGTCNTSTYGGLWDFIQVKFNCCGIHPFPHTGYEQLTYSLQDSCPEIVNMTNRPLSCCVPKNSSVTTSLIGSVGQYYAQYYFDCPTIKPQGCLDAVEWWVGYYSPVLIGVGFGVCMLQIIGYIFAVCVCVNSPRHHRGYKQQ